MKYAAAALLAASSADAWSPWWHHGEWGWNHGYGHDQDQLTVSTTTGHVHGKIDPKLPNARQFLGIPYAQPPVGDLRWKAPQALSQPDAQIQATELPPSCSQFLSTLGNSLYTRDVLEFNLQGLNRTGSTSEDCLTASVWTPTSQGHGRRWWGGGHKKHEGLPVLMYIYGGGFSTGGEDVPYQIPTQWVNRSPNHIVVSFNYRLNVFGFPGAKGLEDQNLGLLDQRAAVEWVYQNIAAFGGNPERMIIFGQSAGAASVDYYNYAYAEDPIVKGLVMESGTALIPQGNDATGSNFSFVASNVGCGGLASNADAELACMRKVPAKTIEDFVAKYSDSGGSPGLSFGPIPDGKSVFADYKQRALDGKQAKIVSSIPQAAIQFLTLM